MKIRASAIGHDAERGQRVAVGVIRRPGGDLLLGRRPAHVEHGDLWEFPGGKRRSEETAIQALARELEEELGIQILRAVPLLSVPHDYGTHRVVLEVFVVDRWRGDPYGREGQEVRWVSPAALSDYRFPAANLPILTAVHLPRAYVVTPSPSGDIPAFLCALERCLVRGARLVQLRAPELAPDAYRTLAGAALALCREHGARLLLNAEPELALALGADGAHLNARRLAAARIRPVPRALWLGASCHSAEELAQAERIGVDFVSVSPVARTSSHPEAPPLGWSRVAALLAASPLPAYALGGVGPAEFAAALRAGCLGIAGIRELWFGTETLDDRALDDRARLEL